MAQQYGTVKCDVITFTSGTAGNETDISITVSGLANIEESGITITGDIQGNNITATGDLNVSGTGLIASNATIGGSLTVSGAGSTYASGLGVSGTFTAETFVASGNATVTGALNVTGDTTLRGNVGSSGLLTSSGLTVTGAISGNTINTTGHIVTTANITGNVINATGNISGLLDGGVYGSGFWKIPAGTTAERPGTEVTGMIRYNETLNTFEGYGEGVWGQLGGGATGSGTDKVFLLNEQTVATSYTIPNNHNATSCGPITINDGIEVIIGDGENWSIV